MRCRWCIIWAFRRSSGQDSKSIDGVTWELTTATDAFTSVAVTPSGNLIGFNNTTKALMRSANNGDSWSDVKPSGDNAMSATAVIAFRWCLRNNGNTMILVEYGTSAALGGRYIFRSTDDGVTWVRVFDAATVTAVSDNQIMHFHGVGYHSSKGRWVAVAGDNAARRTNVYSDDDGITWSVLNAPGTYLTQPLGGLVDYGDPTYLMCGDDGYSSIQKFDVMTGNVVTVYSGFKRDTGHYYVFDLIRHNGVFYAFKATTTASIYDMSIIVSPDGVNWSVYHKFDVADKISQVYYAGFLNGKLHAYTMNTVDNINKHFKMSPVDAKSIEGVVVTPACTNLLNENLSSAETNATYWVNNAVGWTSIGQSSEHALHGTKSVKVVIPALAASGSVSLNSDISLTVGKTYIGSVAVRGSNCIVDIRSYWRPNPTTGQKYTSDSAPFFVDENWKTIYTKPFTVASGEGDFYRLYFTLPLTNSYNVPLTLYFDCAQFTEVPYNLWQVGGTAKQADVLTETVETGNAWTDLFFVQALEEYQYYAAASPLIIKTWALDADNKIVISYDPSDFKFKLTRTVEGVAQTAIESAAQYWHGNACIKFALRVSSTGVQLSIQNGGIIETVTDAGSVLGLLNNEVVATFNDFPCIVASGLSYARIYPFLLSDDDVAEAFNMSDNWSTVDSSPFRYRPF